MSLNRPDTKTTFQNIYSHGFIRVAVCTPGVDVARPSFSLRQTLTLARAASERQAAPSAVPRARPVRVFE
ncbi:MAG: hypothetical protein AMXMBFR67_23300 [Nitrospira sp.]